jgi:hypothetical protein
VARRWLPAAFPAALPVARWLGAALLAAAVIASSPTVSRAQDDAAAFRDLATASDFRVRVAACLVLGKSRSPGARGALERALADTHPGVRAAAAAGLGSLGDARAVPALKAAQGSETSDDVKAVIARSLGRLAQLPATPAPAAAAKPKFLVSVGKIENKSGVAGSTLAPALKTSTRSRMALVPGVELLAEGTDPSVEGKSRNLPAFTVDATLTKLDKKEGVDGVGFAARVEYLIRKMPDHKLSGTMSGTAQALADAKQVRGQGELAQLQIDALSAAVDSALKGASPALEAALR